MKALYVYVGLLLGAAVALLVCSLLVRAAVWLANRWYGGPDAVNRPDAGANNRPWTQKPVRARTVPTIPVPSLLKGAVVALAVWLVQAAVAVGCVLVLVPAGARNPFAVAPAFGPAGAGAAPATTPPPAGVGRTLVPGAIGLTVGFMLWTYLLNTLLPTSFNRAMTVTAFLYGLFLVIWLAVVGVAVAAGSDLGGLR